MHPTLASGVARSRAAVLLAMPDLTPVLELLAETQSMTLATLDADGSPRATPLFFAYDEGAHLYFLSDPHTQHALNLAREPRCAVGLYPPVEGWREIRGLQMKGRAHMPRGTDGERALALYQRRFPFVARLKTALAASKLFCFTPDWVRLIDNRRGFGYHQEWSLP